MTRRLALGANFGVPLFLVAFHFLIAVAAELGRVRFDLASPVYWWFSTAGNVPVWLFALLIGGAYAALHSLRGRWLVWALSFAALLYVVLEAPAARYFGLHMSWRMLGNGLSSAHLTDSAVAEIDALTVYLVVASCAAHFFLAYQIRRGEPVTFKRSMGLATGGLLVLLLGLWVGFAKRIPEHPVLALMLSSAEAGAVRAGGTGLDKDLFSLRFGSYEESAEAREALATAQGYFAGKSERPNVVLLIVESLGAQQALVDGRFDPAIMPNLARLQQRGGVLFDQVVVNQPETFAANIALATAGRHPTWLDPVSVSTRPWQGAFAVDAFRAAGYRTGLFAAADLDYLGLGRFLAQGQYERFIHFGALPEAERERERLDSWGGRDDLMLARAGAWTTESGIGPFFLQAMSNAPHHPYSVPADFVPPAALAKPSDRQGRYFRAVAAVDAAIGQLIERLVKNAQFDNTLFVVMGDHGGGLRRQGEEGHRSRAFDEAVRDFVLFSIPDGRPVRSARVISIGDVMPTAAAIAGISFPGAPGADKEPKSIQNALSPLWEPRLQFFQHDTSPGGWGVRDGQWKYISQASGGSMLFNLAVDPDEKNNLIRQHSARDRIYDQLDVAWYLGRNADFARDLLLPDFLPKLDAKALSSFGLKQLLVGYVEPVGEVGFRVVPVETVNPAELVYIDALWAGFPGTGEVEYRWTAPDGKVFPQLIELNAGFRLHRLAIPAELRGPQARLAAGKWRITVQVGPEALAEKAFLVDAATPLRFQGDMARLNPVRAKFMTLEVGLLDEQHQFTRLARIRPADKFTIRSSWRSGVYDERLEYEIESPQGQVMPIPATLRAGAIAHSEDITPPVELWPGIWKVRLIHEGNLLATNRFEVRP